MAVSDNTIFNIHTRAVRSACKIPYALDIPAKKIYRIKVAYDPEEYYCSEDDLQQKLAFFESQGRVTEYFPFIVPAYKYEKYVYCYENMNSMYMRILNDDIKSIKFKCRYLLQDLASENGQVLIPVKRTTLLRISDAFCNFKNVASIIINNKAYEPEIFTDEKHLALCQTSICEIEAIDMSLPIEFDAVLYSLETRLNTSRI